MIIIYREVFSNVYNLMTAMCVQIARKVYNVIRIELNKYYVELNTYLITVAIL